MAQLPPDRKELSVGQLATRSGVAVSALHFYESKGLLVSRRTPGNQRRYKRDALRRIAFIRAAQRVGIPLDRIKEGLSGLPESRTPTPRDWAKLSAEWRDELDFRIQQLQALRDRLDHCIGCGCLSLGMCALSNPDDALGEQGPGAHRLMVQPPARGDADDDEDPRCDTGWPGVSEDAASCCLSPATQP